MARAALAAVFFLGVNVCAEAQQASAEEPKRSVQERSRKVEEYRALLGDPDPSVRLAALDEMLASDDIVLREVAYGVAFKSTDDAMRAVALKRRFSELKTVVIKIELREGASKKEQRVFTDWGGTYSFGIKGFDEKSGSFETSGRNTEGTGQVVGTALDFSHKYCDGTFKLGAAGVLEGIVGCNRLWEGRYKGSIRLQ